MRKLAIVHFNPLEQYPPVMNWIRYLETRSREEKDGSDPIEVRVYSTRTRSMKDVFNSRSPNIRIIRRGGIPQPSVIRRYWTYIRFYASTIRRLFAWRPDVIFYFETLSAFPAILYRRISGRPVKLLAHYHEYVSPDEYQRGMTLNRWFHRMERNAYPKMDWISHTNEDRKRDFMRDLGSIKTPPIQVMPNYPPLEWRLPVRATHKPLRIVYVGAFGVESMYVREFAEWVLMQAGQVTWDIYAQHMTPATKKFLQGLSSGLITYRGSCDYYQLPVVLGHYDVGVVLYKGIIRNHVIAVANKVFEYLSCGLDVWYSQEMTSTHLYDTTGVYPKVKPLDFNHIQDLDWKKAVDRTGLTYRPSPYHFEDVLSTVYDVIRDAQNDRT